MVGFEQRRGLFRVEHDLEVVVAKTKRRGDWKLLGGDS